MRALRNYILIIFILTGLNPATFGQVSLYLRSDEINLGKKQDIPLLSSSIREALTAKGYVFKE